MALIKVKEIKKPEDEKNLDAEILRLEENLKKLSVMDEEYTPTMEALEKLHSIRQSRDESKEKCAKDRRTKGEVWTKIGTSIAMVALCAAGLFLSYKVDNSDEILRNKQTLGFFNKIFKI